MDKVIEDIYSGNQVEISDLGPILEILQIEIDYDSQETFYAGLRRELNKIVRIPDDISNSELLLVLGYAKTGKSTPELDKIIYEGLKIENKELKMELLFRNSVILENKDLKDEVERLRAENLESEMRIKENTEQIENLNEQINALKLEIIEMGYENGFFIEEEVFRSLEKENVKLTELNENIYTEIKSIWFNLVNNKIKNL